MSTKVSIQDLKKAQSLINNLKKKPSITYNDIALFLSEYRMCGYGNICKMFIEEATPESLKYS